MSTRSALPLLSLLLLLHLLCLAPILSSAAPAVGPPSYSNFAGTNPSESQPTADNSTTPNCTDISAGSGAVYPSCWDSLGMFGWMWNWTSPACHRGEIWSSCFLRLAYGSPGYECATLGGSNCSAPLFGGPVKDPRVFYGAYSIYTINAYFTTWENAVYRLTSQPAISHLAKLLAAVTTPRLTTSSLLSAVINNYGLDPATDLALDSILPTGRAATKLDTNVTYYSSQLALLLSDLLQGMNEDILNGDFLFLAAHGHMVANEKESLDRLVASLAAGSAERLRA